MTEQIERADLARVYRAIGNSQAPMPESVNAFPDGDLHMSFADGNEGAVRLWADAIGATLGRTPLTENGIHRFGTVDGGGKGGTWLGWSIHVYTYVRGPHPVTEAVLGTGDEPADEAIVDDVPPNAGSAS